MLSRHRLRDHTLLAQELLRSLLAVVPMGLVVGSACALFLWLLDRATQTRWDFPWLLFLLPMAGLGLGLMVHWIGGPAEGGNNLILDEIHRPAGGVPLRMAPLVMIGTLITHLFGGSAGREGTAIQMGGSIAFGWSHIIRRVVRIDTRTLLMAGVAAGFGGVFGTPVAGAIFAIEVVAIGRLSYAAILPCLLASVISDWTCAAWSIHHTQYHVAAILDPATGKLSPRIDPLLLAKVAMAGAVFGLASLLFTKVTHGFAHLFKRCITRAYLRPVAGGVIIIALTYLVGTRDYLGIGVTTPDPGGTSIVSAFQPGGAESYSWLLKLLFTAITLAAGFKGGEATPLFFIGATLGNTLAWLMNAPVDLFAAIGFVALFAAATNTPLACTLMAVELFGVQHVLCFAIGCFIAYFFSGHSGIYLSQRIGTPKVESSAATEGTTLRTIGEGTFTPDVKVGETQKVSR